jgi:hypothetical protein
MWERSGASLARNCHPRTYRDLVSASRYTVWRSRILVAALRTGNKRAPYGARPRGNACQRLHEITPVITACDFAVSSDAAMVVGFAYPAISSKVVGMCQV